jgi:hypothetical protein
MDESDHNQELSEQITGLTSEVRKLRLLLENLRLDQYIQTLLNRRRLMWINFLTGIMSGLGGAIGATLVLALLVYILGRLEWIPIIGKWITDILKVVHRKGA